MKKGNLPKKTCTVCGLPYEWRKKWAKNWDEVKYCSERCRRNKNKKKQEQKPALLTVSTGIFILEIEKN